jgi:fatty acid desaturase
MASRKAEATKTSGENPKWIEKVKADVAYDTQSPRREYHVALPKFIHDIVDPYLSDKRDAIMLDLMFNITCVVLPSAAFQFFMPASCRDYATWLGVLHLFIVNFFYTQRFILMLHYSEHRRMFIPGSKFTLLHGYAPYILCPFFGIPAGCYRLHHVVMHHLEDNVFPEDLSSTMPYQRDNFFHFLHYWARFTFAIHFELLFYAIRKKRYGMALETFACEMLWVSTIVFLFRINPTATTFTLIIPFFLVSLMLMFGNWSQHIFVDPDRPTLDYALTYNCINHVENLFTFNDGYHVVHHINSRLHWSEMPQRFVDELPTYAAQGAITFSGLHFFEVGLYVMTGQWSKLYKSYVHLSETPASESEVVAMFKKRLQPCSIEKDSAKQK